MNPRVIFITDPAYDDAHTARVIEVVARALPSGAFAVQLRDKTAPSYPEARAHALRDLTRALGVPLIVNGDVALAERLGAEGLHVPQATPFPARKEFWTSMPAHTAEEVRCALAAGADAVLVSPIFASPGKGAPRGVAALDEAVRIAGRALRVFALGGVSLGNAGACRAAGAEGAALIRALYESGSPGDIASAIHRAFDAPARVC